ncbi:MAG: copper homeostasis protein [Methylobacter sp.]|nr:MAG: copper homeostasis protein [Methylobacter sp.]PPD03500.1 MAG: copper homeostasis protein [Methylobacter sp.]PPD21273.1 MAG: copper homeostasis protein [Methylobacter sp.]
MKNIPNLLLFRLLSLFSLALISGFSQAESSADGAKIWPGIYNGFTPCEDCKGVKTTLAFNQNNTYLLMTQYIGRSNREFVEKGKFERGDNQILVLTSRNGSTKHYYQIDGDNLIQLDDSGNTHTGKLADKYVLQRQDVMKTPPQHSMH